MHLVEKQQSQEYKTRTLYTTYTMTVTVCALARYTIYICCSVKHLRVLDMSSNSSAFVHHWKYKWNKRVRQLSGVFRRLGQKSEFRFFFNFRCETRYKKCGSHTWILHKDLYSKFGRFGWIFAIKFKHFRHFPFLKIGPKMNFDCILNLRQHRFWSWRFQGVDFRKFCRDNYIQI